MAALIDDDLLEHFCVSGDWAQVADDLIERYQGRATRIVSYFAGMAWARDEQALGAWGELARAVRAANPAGGGRDVTAPESPSGDAAR